MKTIEFYKCTDCDSVLVEINPDKKNCQLAPCLQTLIPQTEQEAAKTEKHKPVAAYSGSALSVTVGSNPHPMTEEHFIQWIYIQTKTGGAFRTLSPGEEPKVMFTVKKENVVGIYAYCNLHGLWMADPNEITFHETVCSAEFSEGCID